MRPKRKLSYSVSVKGMMWCYEKKAWTSFYYTDKSNREKWPKGASSHKHFRTANRAWRHVDILVKKGFDVLVTRDEFSSHKSSGGKRCRLTSVWTSEGYYK